MKKNQFKYRLKYKKGKHFQTDKIKLFKFIKAKIILVLPILVYFIYSKKSNIKNNIIINLNSVSKEDHFNLIFPKYKKHQYDILCHVLPLFLKIIQ